MSTLLSALLHTLTNALNFFMCLLFKLARNTCMLSENLNLNDKGHYEKREREGEKDRKGKRKVCECLRMCLREMRLIHKK